MHEAFKSTAEQNGWQEVHDKIFPQSIQKNVHIAPCKPWDMIFEIDQRSEPSGRVNAPLFNEVLKRHA